MTRHHQSVQLSSPRPEKLSEFLRGDPTTLAAVGIVNPFGPTLAVLAVDGALTPGSERRVARISLNPFAQSCEVVGRIHAGERWQDPIRDLAAFLPLPLGSCPTLLLPSRCIEDRLAFHAALLEEFEDGAQVYRRVQRHVGDPWTRVDGEVSSAFDPAGEMSEDQPLTASDARDLARIQLSAANLKAELQAFLFAWKGAIDFQGGGAQAARALQFEDFVQIFSRLMVTCHLPMAL